MNLSKIRWLWHQESVAPAERADVGVIHGLMQKSGVPAKPGVIRVLIVAGEPLVRQRLVEQLAPSPAFAVAAGASAQEGYRLAEQRTPDVAVVGAALPDAPGVSVVGNLRRRVPGLAVIVVTAQATNDELVAAATAGAAAYCGQDIEPVTLMALVRRAFIDDDVIPELLPPHRRSPEALPPLVPKEVVSSLALGALTNRELKILANIRDGMSDQAIGAALELSPQTVKHHVSSIMRTLHCRDRDQAVAIAIKRGWLAAAKVAPS